MVYPEFTENKENTVMSVSNKNKIQHKEMKRHIKGPRPKIPLNDCVEADVCRCRLSVHVCPLSSVLPSLFLSTSLSAFMFLSSSLVSLGIISFRLLRFNFSSALYLHSPSSFLHQNT